jgi:hypothetical protein
MHTCLHEKYPLFLSDINENWIFLQIFEQYLNIKFYENLSRRTDMTKLIVAFRNLSKAHKKNQEEMWYKYL